MRDYPSWRSSLTDQLVDVSSLYGPMPLPPSQLLDTELILTLFAEYLPGLDPLSAWSVLSGQPLPALEALPIASRRAIAVARFRLTSLIGQSEWQQQIECYRSFHSPYPLYWIDGSKITVQPTPILPERLEMMQAALREAPVPRPRTSRYVDKPGRYRFYIDRDPHEVDIPEKVVALKGKKVWVTPALMTGQRAPLVIRLNDLVTEAGWMDQHAPPGSAAVQGWRARMEHVRLSCIVSDGLSPTAELTVDGLFHLIGMVGSGKSTLYTVLAVYLARRGYRVVMVQGDVASLLREQAVFDALKHADAQLMAVPLVGRSTRLMHLNRLHALQTDRKDDFLHTQHPGFAMLSTVCPLDGLRRDVAPIRPGKEPCTRLYPSATEDETPRERRDCPLMPVCPIHLPTQQMSSARIWLATPASLLASGPQAPLVPQQMRNTELVMRYADVVLVDEADAVQVQFDDRFSPFEVLVGRQDAWLDRLGTQVARQVYRPSRPLVGRNVPLDRWLTAHQNTQRTVDRLYRWLRESATTRAWLHETYFTGELLLNRVQTELITYGLPAAPFAEAREAFTRIGIGSAQGWAYRTSPSEAWSNAVQRELLTSDESACLRELEDWFRTTFHLSEAMEAEKIQEMAHRLLIALLVSVLDRAFRDLVKGWNTAEEFLDLDRGTGGLFYHPSDDLLRLVPEAPMGPVLGFQYYDAENSGEGELRFFHVRGMGRSLLYRLHDGLQLAEDIAGPHVILTSGTSWAPGSWRYHLHTPPSAILTSDGVVLPEVKCFFDPLPDPENAHQRLHVSGRRLASERIRNLKAMIGDLARLRGFGNHAMSKFDQEFTQIEEHRRRILLIVGSYAEAEAVGEMLSATLKTAPGEDVLTLIPDSDGDPIDARPSDKLVRSMLPQFPQKSARFLVAPLQAMERGHNILVGQEGAIGSVYFLVRPYPRPGDPHAAIQRINSWATEYTPTLVNLDAGAAGKQLREAARARWVRDLQEEDTYKGTEDKTSLLWTQLVLIWQCIGRLLRGGASARVHFVDAKWAEVSAGLVQGRAETENSSMVAGFRRILTEALNAPSPADRQIAQLLYGPLAVGLDTIKGIHYE